MSYFGGESFGQKLPPLYKVIQGILQDYPSGQIFKEIIQNADDARATEVKFFLDYRNIETLPKTLVDSKCHSELHKYYGNALVAFNDAPFTAKDWDGIQSLQDSSKATDPHRVGKFGLGFNSVYHITDLPVILSEEYCAFLDPHQVIWNGKPGQRYTLARLQVIDPRFVSIFSSVGHCSAGKFHKQTVFRFPLRKYASKMSNEIFSMERLEQLVKVLQSEAHYLLLFLRSVQSIEVIKIHQTNLKVHEQIFKVSMKTADRIKLQKEFFDKMALNTPRNITSYKAHVTIQVEPSRTQHEWALVHYTGSKDEEVLKLAEQQCVLPWVSTACELTDLDNTGGHLFCSLPLPTEERAPFRVSVNGTFAVCSNRRSLKWEEQERHDDEGKWNKYLVEKCLPYCYVEIMQFLMTCIHYEYIYSYYPSVDKLRGTPWEGILKPFYTNLFDTHCVLYTPLNGGQWIGINEAVMLLRNEKRPQGMEQVFLQLQIPFVNAPEVILKAEIYAKFNFTRLTPNLVRDQLRVFLYDLPLTYNDRLSALEYCLSDECFIDLIGLNLLPLANGTFALFSHNLSTQNVFLCSDSIPHTLLPNISDRFVTTHLFSSKLKKALTMLATTKKTQLLEISELHVAKLLVSSQSHLWSLGQLENFWFWLQQGHSLKYFKNAQIVPVQGEYSHHALDKNELIYVPELTSCPQTLASALAKYQLLIVKQSDFQFLKHNNLSSYLRHLTPFDILSAIKEQCVDVLLTINEALGLQQFFTQDHDAAIKNITTISNIPMFLTIQNTLCSLNGAKNGHRQALIEDSDFNIEEALIPSTPLVLSNSKNSRTLLNFVKQLVTYKKKIKYFMEFIFPAINNHTDGVQSKTDEIMKHALHLISDCTHEEKVSYLTALKQVRFLSTGSSLRRYCIPELIDPSDACLSALYTGQKVFPQEPFDSYPYISLLKKCGLKTKGLITGEDIAGIIISLMKQPTNESVHERACALISFINNAKADIFEVFFYIRNEMFSLSSFLRSVRNDGWIPVHIQPPALLHRQTRGKLQWKGSYYGYHLAPPKDVVILDESLNESNLPWIMGSSVCFMKSAETPSQLRHILSHSNSTLINKVLEHFKHVIQNGNHLSSDTLSYVSTLTYEYLSNSECNVNDFDNLKEWIWIECEACFVSPQATAFNGHPIFKHNLVPFVHTLPPKYNENFHDLFVSCGTAENISDEQIVSVLYQLQSNVSLSSDQKAALAVSILQWMIDECIDTSDVLVPIQSDTFEMLPVSEVLYPISDAFRCLPPSATCKLVHSRINKNIANNLQIKTLESHLGISQDIISEDVGQHTPLIDQLKNILQQYQDTDGYTVVKEMLQNADDAGATELNVLFDSRQHTKSSLYFQGMAKAHGPALIIHNNKQFSREDFVNITRLAASHKRKEGSLKIGKFGIGFCSVYHITDIPSFVSANQLYIFDPTLKYLDDHVQDRSQPGQKATFTSQFLHTQTTPFHNLFGFKSNESFNGTIFRLPFRIIPSKLSSKCSDPLEYFKLLCDQLEQDGSKLLLFLTNVKKITVWKVNESSTGFLQPKLIIHKTDEHIPHTALSPAIDFVNITNNESMETWLICSNEKPKHNNILKSSVACRINPISREVEKCDGEMFCFLPLGFIKTGLPVHVSANFSVTANRRGIWVSDSLVPKEEEILWNRCLMNESISSAYYLLLCTLQNFTDRKMIHNYTFHSLWPLSTQLINKNPWTSLVSNMYKIIVARNDTILLTIGSGKWLNMSQSKILYDPILSLRTKSHNLSTPSCVFDVLPMVKNEPIVVLPFVYINEIKPNFRINFFKEMDFISLFFKNVVQNLLNIQLRNNVLLCVFETFSYYLDDYNELEISQFESLLTVNPCLPCGTNGNVLRLCNETVDSSSQLKILFTNDDDRFPHESFMKSPPCKRAIKHLGLIHSKLPHDLLKEVITKIQSVYVLNPKTAIIRLNVIVNCLNLLESLPDDSVIPELNFIPILKKPENYFLKWKGEECFQLVSPRQIMYGQKLPNLVGSLKYILDHSLLTNFSDKTAKVLEIYCKPNADMVLDQLNHLIKTCKTLINNDKMTDKHKSVVSSMYQDIVTFLEQEPDIEHHQWMIPLQLNTDPGESISLSPNIASIPCIWTGHEFVLPSCVASNWKTNGPLLFSLPAVLRDKLHLIKAFGCPASFEVPKLLSSLSLLHMTYKSNPIPSFCRDVLREIITELDKAADDIKFSEVELYLPDTYFKLKNVSDLVYRDVEWCDDKNSFICFVNSMVTASLANRMGVLSTREKSLRHHEDEFVEFGQHEDLTVRINNIISDYPLDATFIKELIQNADDAGATRVAFIFDKRNHDTEKVFSDNWKELQGPALLVWNDSNFSENDLKGIQQIGFGGKRQDTRSETIGKFGIGFNVVYNITDCPSFVTHMSTGKTLCIFDPQCKYIPKASNSHPGGRYNNINKNDGIWEKFRDVSSTFSLKSVKGCSSELSRSITNSGTLFRFPFRTEECFKTSKILHPDIADDGISDDTDSLVTVDILLAKMKEWIDDIKMMLLFLTNVQCLEVYAIENIAENNLKFKCFFSCKNTLQDENKRREYREACCNFKKEPVVVPYILESKIDNHFSETRKKCDEKWFIQQGIGNTNNPNEKWKFLPSLKPRHGIALRLNPPVTEHFRGKLFCFLPLPICTDLPVHLNGQFILTSSRRDLWIPSSIGTSDDNSAWNDAILEALSSSYAIILQALTELDNGIFRSSLQYNDIKQLQIDVMKYFWLFPTYRKIHSAQGNAIINVPSGVWENFAQSVFKKLFECNSKILPSVGSAPGIFAKAAHKIEWSKLFDTYDTCTTNQSYFFFRRTSKDNIESSKNAGADFSALEKALKKIGMNINIAPIPIWKSFNKAVPCLLPKVDQDSVYQYCRQYCSNGLPCSLEKTKFRSLDTFITILEYVLFNGKNGKEFPLMTRVPYVASTWPHDSPFLLTADKKVRLFDKSNPVISCEFFSLFPRSLNNFLHHKLIPLSMSSSYFYNHSEHGNSLLMSVISEALPQCLQSDTVEREYLPSASIYQYLKCFHSGIFKPVCNIILSQWALIPSQIFMFRRPLDEKKPLPFTYLSAFKKLKSCEASKEASSANSEMNEQIVKVLKKIGMPALDMTVFQYSTTVGDKAIIEIDVTLIKALGCPDVEEPSSILHNFLFCQKKGFICELKNLPGMSLLYKYLGQVNFKDLNNKSIISSLPLFKTVSGTLSSLTEEVYIWPTKIPSIGLEKMASNTQNVTFLCENGDWEHFGVKEVLNIRPSKPEWLYVKFIFKSFQNLDDDDRAKHLEFIRDHRLDICLTTIKQKEENCLEQMFIDKCHELPIIKNTQGKLCCASFFADHRENIFQVFNGVFKLLPQESCYRENKWMNFLSKIGLKTKLDEELFVELCKAVESRDCNKYEDLSRASNELLEYLLNSCHKPVDKCPWSNPWNVIHQVADIKFIILQRKPCLDDIAPQYINDTRCITVSDNCILTELKGTATVDCADLVWTVKPIINIQLNDHSRSKFQECGITAIRESIKSEDVISNLCNIARKSKYAKSDLFNHYPYPHPSNLMEVIIRNLKHLSNQSQLSSSHNSLCTIKCIPVTVGDDSERLILVEPSTVVNHNEPDNLKPFLHCLPEQIKTQIPLPFLESIGIQPYISVKHCWKVLHDMHSYSRGQPLDVNTREKLGIILNCLSLQLESVPCDKDNFKSPLYLPDIEDRLKPSTELFYIDDQRFFSKSNCIGRRISIFQVHSNRDLEKQICHVLPTCCRPLPLSLSCHWSLVPHCSSISHSEFTCALQRTVRHPLLLSTLKGILKSFHKKNPEFKRVTNAIFEYFESFIYDAEVVCKSNLQVSLSMNKTYICSSPVKYYINQDTHCICIDSKIGSFDSKFHVCLPMASTIIKSALWRTDIDCEVHIPELEMTVATLLEANEGEHFQAIIRHLQIEVDHSMQVTSKVFQPILGDQVPSGLHNRFDHNREDAVFRYMEWVAYEQQTNYYIFAKIIHLVYNITEETSEPRQYSIIISDEGIIVNVSVNCLYKFLPYVPVDGNDNPSDPYNIKEPVYFPNQYEGNRWLKQSDVDMIACTAMYEKMLNFNQCLAGHVCFLSHQVVEKVLKGVMYVLIGSTNLTSHHLKPLASILAYFSPNNIPQDIVNKAATLDNYYIPTRYPNACRDNFPAEYYTVKEAKIAFCSANYIYTTLKQQYFVP